jgi:hypothetical protein
LDRVPVAPGAEIDDEILDRIVHCLADQTRAEDERQQMKLAEYEHRHGERGDDAECGRQETEHDEPRRAKHPQHQKPDAAQRHQPDQMHFALRRTARGFGIKDGAQAIERDVGMRLAERSLGARESIAHRTLHARFIRRSVERRGDEHAGRIAAMRDEQAVFEFEIRRRERQTAEIALQPAERIVGERRREAAVERAVKTLKQRFASDERAVLQRGAIGGREQAEAVRQIKRADRREIERRQRRDHRAERAARSQRRAELLRRGLRVFRVRARHDEDRAIAERGGHLVGGFFGDGIDFGCGQQREEIGLQRRRPGEAPAAIRRRDEREQQPRDTHAPELSRRAPLQDFHHGAPNCARSAGESSPAGALPVKSICVASPLASTMRKPCRKSPPFMSRRLTDCASCGWLGVSSIRQFDGVPCAFTSNCE